jgi:hypothetical protein
MSNPSDSLDQQIAALEQALMLPLPAATRAQIEQDVRTLRAQRMTQRAEAAGTTIEGMTNVSGSLHGSAVGVNFGTVQTFSGTAPPTSDEQTTSTASQEEIDEQRALLDAHRRTLAIYLTRLAKLGSANTPPEVVHGIREARDAIRRIKATLRGWGVTVPDHPDDAPAI